MQFEENELYCCREEIVMYSRINYIAFNYNRLEL